MQVVEKALDIIKPGKIAGSRFFHGRDSFGIRNEWCEGERFLSRHPRKKKADSIGDREAHGFEDN